MAYRVYAMDFSFYNSMGIYSFEARCEMLKEIGYDAMHLSVWHGERWRDAAKLGSVKRNYGLDVAGVYVVLDLSLGEGHPRNQGILQLLETLEGCSTVELAIQSAGSRLRPSDPAGDDAAAKWLETALAVCERRGIDLLLYPHLSFWLERHEDAVRLCRRLNHPRVGIVFCGFHWYAVDGTNLKGTLEAVAPYLKQANLSGSRRNPHGFEDVATIEPLDEGELDNFALLGQLKKIGFQGMIGFQGWSEGGDAYSKLKRSLQAFRDMERRLEAHPHWAELKLLP
jgi:sugar phosphate isomerase/epimerase